MKKSNVIVFVLLALASAFFLWLWYFLGLNRVDEPLDLVLSIVWWLVIVVAIAVPLMVVVAWCLMWGVDYVANRGKRMISQQRSRSTKVDHHG